MSRRTLLLALPAWLAARSARAGGEAVYRRTMPDGRPWLTNEDPDGQALLVLAGHAEEVWSFRRRFRTPVAEPEEHEVPPARSGPLRPVAAELVALVDAAAARAGLNPDLVRAVVLVESGFQVRARSPAGAVGLMQLMPATAARFGVTERGDARQNLHGGTQYLAFLLQRFRGDVRLALAGYNAGEGAVDKHGGRIPPYPETRAYVPAVLSAWRRFHEARLGRAKAQP